MTSFKAWFLAVRPKTLPAAIVPVWAGCVLAWAMEGVFLLPLAIATVAGSLFIQIATNFFNDVIDCDKGTDTDARLGPQRVTASGLITRDRVIRGALLMLVAASLCGMYLWWFRGWWIIAIGVPSLYLSYGYTGGPFPLAYRGFGEVFVILFFGLIAVTGTVFVQLGYVPAEALILGLQIGLLSAALIAINNCRDVDEDRQAGKRTIVVRFGRRFGRGVVLLATCLPYPLILLFDESTVNSGSWFGLSSPLLLIFGGIIWSGMNGKGSANGVENRLLGIAAIHLIVFVVAQTCFMTLT